MFDVLGEMSGVEKGQRMKKMAGTWKTLLRGLSDKYLKLSLKRKLLKVLTI